MHFHVFKPKFLGFLKNFGFFQNQRGFCVIFGMGFEDSILKTSCIAFHVHYNCIFMHLVVLYMLNCLCAGRFGFG